MPRPVILCVDDERTVLSSLKEQLRRRLGRECIVEIAESGEDALEVIAELVANGDDLAVVISDHIMPGMKGDELLFRVHRRHPEVRKIMLTGQASPEAVGNAVNRAGLYRYLPKPWEANDLELTVRGALSGLMGDRAREEQQAMLREMADVALGLTAHLAGADRYARLVESARRVLRADRALVLRFFDDELRLLATSHPGPSSMTLADAGDLAMDFGGTLPVRRSGNEAEAVSVASIGWPARDRSLVTVALRVAGEVVGLLVVGSDRPGSHRAASDERVLAFASLAAASIRTTELVDALEASSEQRRRVAVELQREAAERGAGALLGDSSPISELRRDVALQARSGAPTLIVGPPGSGCEAAARALHAASENASGPFILVEGMLVRDGCDLLGASEDRTCVPNQQGPRGKLGLAQGGTLYIAGIDALPRAVQEELARGIGAGAGARIVGSARREPGERLDPSLARALGTQRLRIPALRERLEDLPALAEHFIRAHARRMDSPVERLSEQSIARMRTYAWPGNVRELSHVVERAVVTATGPVAEVAESLHTGFSVGSYQLDDRLGVGGMGEVWRAHHMHLSRPAAVKLIRGGRQLQAATLERFRREAAATAELRSPHTVELYDFGVAPDGELFLVMELLEGLDLHSLVQQYGPVPAPRAIHLIRQACLSLGEAHAAGLVHRDVKPANLFACQLGLEHDFLKLLDFGMVTANEGDTALTQEGQIAGTPAFMAPEAASQQELDGRADLYALGCVLYWLLTGRNVFEGANIMHVLVAHMSQEPNPPSKHTEHDIPEELDQIVLRCLAKDPALRPASALELFDALGDVPVAPWTRVHAQDWWVGRRNGTIPTRAPAAEPSVSGTLMATSPEKPGRVG